MAIVRLPDNGTNKRFSFRRDQGAAIGNALAAQGSEITRMGNKLSAAGIAYFKETQAAEAQREYSDTLTKASLDFNKQYQDRLATTVDKEGNPTYKTLVDDVATLGNEVMGKYSSKMMDPKARAKFENTFSRLAGNKQLSAFGEARNQQIAVSKNTLQNSIDATMANALSDDLSNINHHREILDDLMQEGLESGVLSVKGHTQLKKEVTNEFNKRVYGAAIMKDPQATLNMLQNSKAADLGVEEDTRLKLMGTASAKMRQLKREEKRLVAEQEAVTRKGQSQASDELLLDIVEGKDVESEVYQAANEGRISTKQQAQLLQKLKSANNNKNSKLESFKSIDKSIAEGKLITAKPKQVGEHYEASVKSIAKGTQDPTLSQKATVANRYTTAVKPFQKELEFSALSGNREQQKEALSAFRFLENNNSRSMERMNPKARAVLSTANTLMNNTNMNAGQAMDFARKKVLEVKDPEMQARKKEFRKVEDFKPQNLEETIKDMYDLDSFLGFGGSEVPDGMRQRIGDLLGAAYQMTGDEDSAKALVKSWTKNVVGTSEVNGDSEFMMLPRAGICRCRH